MLLKISLLSILCVPSIYFTYFFFMLMNGYYITIYEPIVFIATLEFILSFVSSVYILSLIKNAANQRQA